MPGEVSRRGRRGRRRREAARALSAQAVALGTEFGLGAHEWSRTERIYSPEHHRSRLLGWIVLPSAVATSPIAVVALLSSDPAAFETGLIFGPMVACLGLAGVWMIRRARLERVDRTFCYADGVVELAGGEPKPRVLRWDDAVSLSVRVLSSESSDPYLGSATVRDRAGNEVTVRGPGLSYRVAEVLGPRLVPALLEAFDRGEPVGFGPVRIDQQGITVAAPAESFVAWADMRQIRIDARTRVAVRTADRKKGLRFDLDDDVPGGFFACYVIERGAAGAGVPVEYREEKKMPPRDVAGLPAG